MKREKEMRYNPPDYESTVPPYHSSMPADYEQKA